MSNDQQGRQSPTPLLSAPVLTASSRYAEALLTHYPAPDANRPLTSAFGQSTQSLAIKAGLTCTIVVPAQNLGGGQ